MGGWRDGGEEEEGGGKRLIMMWSCQGLCCFCHISVLLFVFWGTPSVEFTQVGNLISPQSFLGEHVLLMVLHPYEGASRAPEAPHCVSQQPVLP